LIFDFTELHVPNKHGKCRRYGYNESGQTVQKSASKQIHFQKLAYRTTQEQQQPETLALVIKILCKKAGKAVHFLNLTGDNPSIRIVQQIVI